LAAGDNCQAPAATAGKAAGPLRDQPQKRASNQLQQW